MWDIILIQPSDVGGLISPGMYPTGLGILWQAAILERAGVKVAIADLRNQPNDASLVPQARFYGLSSTTPQILRARALARALKERDPSSITVLGGPHASVCYHDEVDFFNVVAIGEWWWGLLDLLQEEHPQGVHTGDVRLLDLDKLPLPARHLSGARAFSYTLLPGEFSGSGEKAAMIISALGCPQTPPCIAPDTLIALADGGEKRIAEIKSGDMILTKDGIACVTACRQTRAAASITKLEVNGRTLSCTPDHLILTPQGWREAGALKEGDRVAFRATVNSSNANRQGKNLVIWASITSVRMDNKSAVYDLEAWPYHNFIASGIIVHNCSFCANLFGTPVRFRSPAHVVAEVQDLKERFGCCAFRDENDDISANVKWLLRYCHLLVPLEIRWKAHARSNHLLKAGEGAVVAMKEAGLVHLGLGVESADPHVLKLANKRETVEQHEAAIALLKKHSIRTQVYFVAGLPGETEDTLRLNTEFMARNKPDAFTLSRFIPLPGCAVWSDPRRYEATILRHSKEHWFFTPGFAVEYPGASQEVLEDRYQRLFAYLKGGSWRR